MTGQAAFRLLFYRPGEAGEPVSPEDIFLRRLEMLLDRKNTCEKLNHLARVYDAEKFKAKLFGEIFNAFTVNGIMPGELTGDSFSPDAAFLLDKVKILIGELCRLPETDADSRSMLMPKAEKLFAALVPDPELTTLAKEIAAADPFITRRVFNYRDGRFFPVEPSSAKSVDKFFGFPGVRLALQEHFQNFHRGKTSLPLLINSLPGYGKTSMVISFALSVPDTVVILPDPEALENSWHSLIDTLSARHDRRFVLFFDDIDPRSVNWYNFRTNVGGAFTPPGNILPVLTANYEFPPSILSRGRRISYPVFDEERCMEMIEDFLGTFGMKKPPRNIVSLMGAEYTEEFGQKKFTELSPRTLMRHLAAYENDPRKRKQIVELSGGGMITRPDAELFYEFNIELMRSLYGEEYIQRLLKERLRSL
ncbi:MAG: hypothetical protein IKD23_08945 [Lentisphaeria bacterium]|nr:hypothetical protein [Lentisphaeria bacterium]